MKQLLLSILLLSSVNVFSQCIEITSIFPDACGTPEGLNEMFTFTVGSGDIYINDLSVTAWPTVGNNFLNWCTNANTDSATVAINSTILSSCGLLLEPLNDTLPANSNVLVITSENFDVTANSFNGLIDTMYVLYQCGNQTTGHFANGGTGTRFLTVDVIGSCLGTETVVYEPGLLTGGNGATVTYDAPGNPSYINNGCNAPVVSVNPSWNIEDVCQTSSPINLNTLLSSGATNGGTWSGSAGVVDSIFNPSGIMGTVSITYSLAASGSCATGLDSTINFNVVSPPVNGTINEQSCDSLFLGGTWYYSDTTLNTSISGLFPYSCDSTYSTIISITSEIIDSSYFESCTSYTFEGVVYTSDTILYDTLTNSGSSGGGVTCAELYFSEYAEGSSNNKYFEIFNGTGAAVNLANYSVERYNNGATAASDFIVLSGMLTDGDVYVIYNSGANATITSAGDLASTLTFYNGDDALALFNGTNMIDLIGNIGCDPGTEWGTGTLITKEATIVRNANYTSGVTVDPANVPCDFPSLNTTNWTGLPQDDFSNIGFHASSCSGSISSGCDTIRIVEINILESVSSTQNITACDSTQILGNWIYASTSINDTIINASTMGCDSIVTYTVQINNSVATNVNTTSCNPADTGIVVQNLMTSNNCDSIHTITTTLILGDSTFATATSCNPLDTGFSTMTFIAVNTCDSLHTIYTSLISCGFCFDNDTANICSTDSVFLQGAWQNTSGNYYDTIVSPGIAICDTILETNLFVSSVPNSTTTNVCTNDFTQVSTITDTLYNALACDSFYNVTNTFLIVAQTNTISVCTNDPLLVGSVTDTLFSLGNCDSVYNVTNTVLLTPTSEAVSTCTNDATMAGVQMDTILSSGNCDSVYQTNTITFISPTYIQANDICTNNSGLANIDTVLTTQSVGGCDSILTITETVYQMPQTFPLSDVSICEGETASIFGNNESISGVYSNTLINSLGCDSVIETIALIVNPTPNVDAGIDESILSGEEVALSASGADSYLWSTSENTENITVSPNTTTVYILTGTDLNNCSGEDSVVVNVVPQDELIQIPTAFSPNADGVNDTFRIANELLFEDIVVRVYNRWGELVFNSTENISGWDGVYKNQKQPVDSYVYYINAVSRSTKEAVSVSGSVTLLR